MTLTQPITAVRGCSAGVTPSVPEPGPGPRSVVSRTLALLAAFGSGDVELSLAELSRRTGIPKSTAHRLIGELAVWGVVERSSSGVRLGMRLFELGALAPRPSTLRDVAAPVLADLFGTTHETVHLAVRVGVDVVYVQKIVGRRSPPLPSRIGGRMPAYCTGVGKTLIAHAPPELVETVVAAGLARRTPRSIDTPGRLARELASVVERGFAEEHEESTAGIACVAAPVFGMSGAAVAAVSVSGWASRLDTRRLAPAVREAALAITRRLAHDSSTAACATTARRPRAAVTIPASGRVATARCAVASDTA